MTAMNKKCTACGKLFATNSMTKQRCDDCIRAGIKAPRSDTVTCERCGKVVPRKSYSQRYCPDCSVIAAAEYNKVYAREMSSYAAYRRMPHTFQCAVCGKDVVRTASSQKYCGPDCAKKADRMREKQRRENRQFVSAPTESTSKKHGITLPDGSKLPPGKRPVPADFCEKCIYWCERSCSLYYSTGVRRDVSQGVNTCGSRKTFADVQKGGECNV